LQFQNRDLITKGKTLIDFAIKIAVRIPQKNRDPILRSVSNRGKKPVF